MKKPGSTSFMPRSCDPRVCYHMTMATYSLYSQIVRGTCGPSVTNPASVHCVLIRKCDRDIRGHLKAIGVSDSSLNKSRLLLAKAGQCIRNSISSLTDRKYCGRLSRKC